MKNLYLLAVLLIALQGCAGVSQPVAKIPLVQENLDSESLELVAKKSWSLLSEENVGSTISLKSQPARLGKLFFAANGKQCRQFYFEQDLVRIVCKDKYSEQWHFVKPVISEYVEISMQE